MYRIILCISFGIASLTLAACSADDASQNNQSEPDTGEYEGEERAGIDTPQSSVPDNQTNHATTNQSTSSSPRQASEIPLTPGVYVLAGTSCGNPANAAWRIWTGEGLSGSTTRECRATIASAQGNRFTLDNSCQNTYDGSRTSERLTMKVTDQVHFTIGDNAFESCSMAQVPETLRDMVTP